MNHKTEYRVIYGDTDAMGIVYHANYFRWFEIGRSEMFRFLGVPYKTIETKGFMLPVSEVHCKFISPIRYDDLVTIETSLDISLRAGMKFDYCIFGESGGTLAEGYSKHAFVDQNGRVVRPPGFVKELIDRMRGE